MNIKVCKLDKNAILPTSNEGDAGYDVYALCDQFIPVNTLQKVRTGISIEPPQGTFVKIEDRSSVAAKGLKTSAGIIDETYRGEILVVVNNISNKQHYDNNLGSWGYLIEKGTKFAQFLVLEYFKPKIVEVTELQMTTTTRHNKGFGSTGV